MSCGSKKEMDIDAEYKGVSWVAILLFLFGLMMVVGSIGGFVYVLDLIS
jgi:hypothetical protein